MTVSVGGWIIGCRVTEWQKAILLRAGNVIFLRCLKNLTLHLRCFVSKIFLRSLFRLLRLHQEHKELIVLIIRNSELAKRDD